jgi:hypothetical protein
MFLNSLVKGTTKSTFVYSDNGFIAFDWNDENGVAPSGKIWPENFHDIYCTFGSTRILLTISKVDIARIKSLLKQDLVDYIYIPWQNPSYTSTMFATFVDVYNAIVEMDKEMGTMYANKLVIYGFPNDAAIELASKQYGSNFPINARQLFLSDAPVESADEWLCCITYGEAVKIATSDYHLMPVHCCCGHSKYHPVWPRPYNPMMYAPPLPQPVCCHHYDKHNGTLECPVCGQYIIIKETTVTAIDGATQTITDICDEMNDDTNNENNG